MDIETRVKEEINQLKLEITEDGQKLIEEYGKIKIFYLTFQKSKKRKCKKKFIVKLNQVKTKYLYIVRINEFWNSLFLKYKKFFLEDKAEISKEKIIEKFSHVLKQEKIHSPLHLDMIKVPNISLLPDFNFIFEVELKEHKNYFKDLKKFLLRNKRKKYFFILESIKLNHSMKIIARDNSFKGRSKRRKEIEVGDDFNRDRKKMVSLKRVINRENSYYSEKIEDKENGEIIRECYENLTEHRNRGSAKK